MRSAKPARPAGRTLAADRTLAAGRTLAADRTLAQGNGRGTLMNVLLFGFGPLARRHGRPCHR